MGATTKKTASNLQNRQHGQPPNARTHSAGCFCERNPERRVSESTRQCGIERSHYWYPKLAAAQSPNPVTEPPERKTAQCTSTRCRVLSRAESGTASERKYAAAWDRTIQLLVSQTSSSPSTQLSHRAPSKENSPMYEHTLSGAFASGIRNGE